MFRDCTVPVYSSNIPIENVEIVSQTQSNAHVISDVIPVH